MRGRVLIVAGSDSGGGAGIQADIKTVTALGGYAATAVTAVTVQNTLGVTGIHAIPAQTVAAQILAVLEDIGADVIKTGMLGSGDIIDTVFAILRRAAPSIPLIVDPVMVAKGGATLLDGEALLALKGRLLTSATLITPNLPEAEALTGRKIASPQDMRDAIPRLLELGPKAVLLKGGHLEGDRVVDIYAGPDGTQEWSDARIDTRHTHGTGCTLASAIATGFAQSLSAIDSITRARLYVRRAIETAPGFGRGHGPLNHAHTVRPTTEE
ncbi:MAG: bifunctional hydroxymethylpyrimidine kinase/phosphomethylpyrimidine kinase [Alphaproteobacteria bacterium]|nr:bifunctional hydroxymethylpyrimidine kinase/phosphomethylpyrimidine kinase [Alphaproteobacteria bacterium]